MVFKIKTLKKKIKTAQGHSLDSHFIAVQLHPLFNEPMDIISAGLSVSKSYFEYLYKIMLSLSDTSNLDFC